MSRRRDLRDCARSRPRTSIARVDQISASTGGHLEPPTMEHLWRRAGAAGGNRTQIGTAAQHRMSLQTAASDCQQLRRTAHGKEGVDGSSPSEGSAKAPHVGAFLFGPILFRLERAGSPSLVVRQAGAGIAAASMIKSVVALGSETGSA